MVASISEQLHIMCEQKGCCRLLFIECTAPTSDTISFYVYFVVVVVVNLLQFLKVKQRKAICIFLFVIYSFIIIVYLIHSVSCHCTKIRAASIQLPLQKGIFLFYILLFKFWMFFLLLALSGFICIAWMLCACVNSMFSFITNERKKQSLIVIKINQYCTRKECPFILHSLYKNIPCIFIVCNARDMRGVVQVSKKYVL